MFTFNEQLSKDLANHHLKTWIFAVILKLNSQHSSLYLPQFKLICFRFLYLPSSFIIKFLSSSSSVLVSPSQVYIPTRYESMRNDLIKLNALRQVSLGIHEEFCAGTGCSGLSSYFGGLTHPTSGTANLDQRIDDTIPDFILFL